MSEKTENQKKVFMVEVAISEAPSWLSETIRRGGLPPPGHVPGNITSRRVESEKYYVLASGRDEAIERFREMSGYRGRIERSFEIDQGRARAIVAKAGGRRVRFHIPDSEWLAIKEYLSRED